jgi:hypothetical protein
MNESNSFKCIGGTTALTCSTKVRTDFDLHDKCYVTHLAHSQHLCLVAAALTNARLKLYKLG